MRRWSNLTQAPCSRCGRIVTTTVHALIAPHAKARWGILCERCTTETEQRQMIYDIGEEATGGPP